MDHSDKKGKNIIDIQESNRSLVLQILTENDICTRVQIAEQTGLQQASITKIIREFRAAGIVSEVCMMTGKKGRRSIGLRLNSHLFKVIGVKISKDMFQVGVFDIKGQRLSVYSERTERLQVPVIVRRIRNSIDKALEEYHDIYAIGMSIPGPYCRSEGKILMIADRHGWDQVSLIDEFVKVYPVPVIIEHDANAGALAEWRYGSFKNKTRTLVHFLASEGIGAGIVRDGAILLGNRNVSEEIGHVSIDYKGPRCECGNYGCMRLYCSALALVEQVKEQLPGHPESLLAQEPEITADCIFSAMRHGDPFAIEAVKQVGYYMGCGLVNVMNLFDPDYICISDIMVGGGQVMLDAIRETVRARSFPFRSREPDIQYSALKTETVFYGAAAVAIDYLIHNFGLIAARIGMGGSV